MLCLTFSLGSSESKIDERYFLCADFNKYYPRRSVKDRMKRSQWALHEVHCLDSMHRRNFQNYIERVLCIRGSHCTGFHCWGMTGRATIFSIHEPSFYSLLSRAIFARTWSKSLYKVNRSSLEFVCAHLDRIDFKFQWRSMSSGMWCNRSALSMFISAPTTGVGDRINRQTKSTQTCFGNVKIRRPTLFNIIISAISVAPLALWTTRSTPRIVEDLPFDQNYIFEIDNFDSFLSFIVNKILQIDIGIVNDHLWIGYI